MLRVGLTGSIGSGKTAVSSIFAALGVPVIDMDVVAREVVAPGQPGLDLVVQHFGPKFVDSRGHLDRHALRALVFNDTDSRNRLESLLHPLIRSAVQTQLSRLQSPYCVIVIPLLFESEQQDLVDFVVVVDADEDTCIQRICTRDATDADMARKMLGAQADRATRLKGADAIIHNNGSLEDTTRQTKLLHERLTKLSQDRA